MVLHVLLTGRHPYEGTVGTVGTGSDGPSSAPRLEQGDNQLSLEGLDIDAPGEQLLQCEQLLRGMLAWEPSQRLSMVEVCTHPWLDVAKEVEAEAEAAGGGGGRRAVEEDVLGELLALSPAVSRDEAAASVRQGLHDSLNTAYQLLRSRKQRELESRHAAEAEAEEGAAPVVATLVEKEAAAEVGTEAEVGAETEVGAEVEVEAAAAVQGTEEIAAA